MNRPHKAQGLLFACVAAATLLTASVRVSAQLYPEVRNEIRLDPNPTFPTNDVGARISMRPQHCVITNSMARMSGAGPQAAKLIAVSKEWWVSAPTSANPQVGYKLWLGLENPRGFPTWTPQVKFELVEVRRDIAAGESAAMLLSGRGVTRSILMPSAPIQAGQQVKAQSAVELVVPGRQRPAWWIRATDNKSGQLLGLCSIDDMTVLDRNLGEDRAANMVHQPLPSGPAPVATSAPAAARPAPNWGELKSPQ